MENIDELQKKIEENIFEISPFYLSCIFKDICLKNYVYRPTFGTCNEIIHQLQHKYSRQLMTLDMLRKLLVDDIFDLLSELQVKYLSESQKYNGNVNAHEILQRKIKKLYEICIIIHKGLVFKEFIDNYRNGYFTPLDI